MRFRYDLDFSLIEQYFTYKDSFKYCLCNGFDRSDLKFLYLRLSDRRIYFVNGTFKKGLQVLDTFRKLNYLI